LSKIVQVNKRVIYLVGGDARKPSFPDRQYDVLRSCIKVDIISGVFELKTQMSHRRSAFGVCVIGKLIYLVGGLNNQEGDEGIVKGCERYDVVGDKWQELPKKCDVLYSGITVDVIKKRYIYGFGGMDWEDILNVPANDCERIMRLDHLKLDKGW